MRDQERAPHSVVLEFLFPHLMFRSHSLLRKGDPLDSVKEKRLSIRTAEHCLGLPQACTDLYAAPAAALSQTAQLCFSHNKNPTLAVHSWSDMGCPRIKKHMFLPAVWTKVLVLCLLVLYLGTIDCHTDNTCTSSVPQSECTNLCAQLSGHRPAESQKAHTSRCLGAVPCMVQGLGF